MVEILVARRDVQPFGPCEIVEMPPLRDGHLRAGDIDEIAVCDVLVSTTIGSQAGRLIRNIQLASISVEDER
jgi:hypothetical protein